MDSPDPQARMQIDQARLRMLGLVAEDGERASIADECRRIKRHLLRNEHAALGRGCHNARLVGVTSAMNGEGKSHCALRLLAPCAHVGLVCNKAPAFAGAARDGWHGSPESHHDSLT